MRVGRWVGGARSEAYGTAGAREANPTYCRGLPHDPQASSCMLTGSCGAPVQHWYSNARCEAKLVTCSCM